MGFIENFKKLGYRFRSANEKPKMTKREALKEIHTMMLSAEITDGPIFTPAEQQKFAKQNVNQYTDEQVNRIFQDLKTLMKEYEIHKNKQGA